MDGVTRRFVANSIVEQAETLYPQAAAMISKASDLRDSAKRELSTLQPYASEIYKAGAWDKEDKAQKLQREATLRLIQAEQLLM